jgi:RimJ/RimL family protein N-acetyltransferase
VSGSASRSCPVRPVAARDHDVLRGMRLDVRLQHMLMANPPPGGDPDVEAWVARREASGFLWTIADAETDGCLGFVQISDVHRMNAHGWFGIALAPEARGRGLRGLAPEVTAAVEAEARAAGLVKLMAQIRTDNAGVIRLYERLGYGRVGVMRRHYNDGEKRHDVMVLEKLL